MAFYWFVLAVLAVWRLTHLLNAEDGPWHLIARMRGRLGAGFGGSLVACFYCLSLWVAAPFAVLIGGTWKEILLLWLALSGGASLLERACAAREGAAAAPYFEDKENDDGLLRPRDGSRPPES
jgi:hypothetical protein